MVAVPVHLWAPPSEPMTSGVRMFRFRLGMTRLHDQNGAVLIMVAFASIALFGFLGLAMDVGYVYHHRRVMQPAADAGAIAGATEIFRGRPPAEIVASAFAGTAINKFPHGTDGVVVT